MPSFKSNQGSALIVALIFAAVIAISLTSFLALSLNTSRLANRAFYFNAAQDLADTGLEHVLWSLNNEVTYPSPNNWTTGGFAARSGFANEYQGTFPSSGTYNLSGGATGQVKAYVNYDPAINTAHAEYPNAYAVVQATITLGDGTTLSKTVKSHLQQRSFSGGGMVARQGISFNGNVTIDSWVSGSDTTTTSDDQIYSTSVRRTEARVASPSLITVQNADVFGRAAIGTDTFVAAGLTVGSTGRLRGAFTDPTGVDLTRLTFDFTASFPDVSGVPTSGTSLAPITTGTTTLGNGTYLVASINMSGSSPKIEVGASTATNAVMVVSGNVDMSGSTQIIVYPGSTLKMYVAGNFRMTGSSGIQNGTSTTPNTPAAFELFGTRTEANIVAGSTMQDWLIRGGSYLSAVIYGPNANIEVNGTGDTYGSVVGNRVDMVGSGNFHQDESLRNRRTSGLWALSKWRELSQPAEKATFSTALAF